MSSSDENLSKLSEKEQERRKRKNKKKKESKKNNRKTRELESAGIELDEAEKILDAPVAVKPANKKQNDFKDSAYESDSIEKPILIDDVVVNIEYVGDRPKLDEKDPNFSYFMKVFETFKVKTDEELKKDEHSRYVKQEIPEDTLTKAAISEKILQEELSQRRKEAEESGEVQKMSRRKLRLALQPSIADLKAATARADVVEWADVTSRDPFLLVELKAYRNTVMVPRHWNAKRKYLAGKRGFERPPFELPDFIKRTGIMEMRETMWEKEENQSLKSKMREKTRPKLGRIDIDYQKLHDAFFKWQTKPQMTKMGELYYEGKELEAQMKDKKPGSLSDELRIALGMPVGPNSHKFPPPWLIAMQRYGPPPSYPNLKIPGLNCPIPEGCAFGYHAGGWGKPPVDEYGKPIYGDVFGLNLPQINEFEEETNIERRHWGEFASDEDESEEESEEGDEEIQPMPPPHESGFVTPATTEGFATPSGITTVPGIETPGSAIEIRKKKAADESLTGSDTPAQLYTILTEKRAERVAGHVMGTGHIYDLSTQRKMPVPNDGVEVSINPEELDMIQKEADQSGLERKYEEVLRKQNRIRMDNEEDFSDMVAEHSAKANRKRKVQEQKKTDKKTKYKDYKF